MACSSFAVEIEARVKERNLKITYTDDVLDWLAEDSYSKFLSMNRKARVDTEAALLRFCLWCTAAESTHPEAHHESACQNDAGGWCASEFGICDAHKMGKKQGQVRDGDTVHLSLGKHDEGIVMTPVRS